MTETICAPIKNYYGAPFIEESAGEFFLCLDDWDGIKSIKVSKEFSEAWKKEFRKE